jgi:hypothetical protein
MKEILYKLESRTPGTAEFDKLVEEVMDRIRPHHKDEEINELPTLESKLGPERSKQAAASFTLTQKFVPTRLV